MRYFYIFLLCFLSTYNLSGQTSKQEMFDTQEKMAGRYYAYPEKDIVVQKSTPAPKGYQPFYISHFGRHGSRYQIDTEDYKWVMDLFADASKSKALTTLGVDVYNRLQKVWEEAEGHGGDLSPLGVLQHNGIAKRMYRSYPEVFTDSTQISARSTMVVRCVLSMDAFCEGLKELNPKLKIRREACDKYMYYLSNTHTEEAKAYRSAKDTWKEEFRKFEQSHTKPDRLCNSLFSDSIYIVKKVNPFTLMWGLHAITSGMQNMETKISFYDLFEKQELFDMWQCTNYYDYVCHGNSALNGGIMFGNGKAALKNIISSANEVISSKGKSATLRFSHDGNLMPLVMILHLQDTYNSVSEPTEFYKAWSNFKIAPMAGNVQLVFFRDKKSDDVIVKFLLNEKETLVPTIKSDILPYYHWKDVETYYNSLL